MLHGLSQRPEHAARLGMIVACSGQLETLLGYLLAHLTQASASVTIAMFDSVTSTDAQRAMLTAAAEQALAGAELLEFRDLMAEFRTRYGERSRLVHNVWGYSPQHPDKAIWCQSKDATSFSARFMAAAVGDDTLDLFVRDIPNPIWRSCSTYTVKDLTDVYERLDQYADRIRAFIVKLQLEHPVLGPRLAPADEASDGQASAPPLESPPDQNQE
ncbi:hypothetical protein [Phenylobacterium sp.]|uniref:hypothetical protein n=1 Tax=Phenylobacterium sp. TaxID=1871053 RepID=UPI0025F4FB6D|nr:hypothetical protein [Phenylobacterium sp.]MBX3484804.1 hypothetical protein [Phenylobacterium sp.]MCW5759075.1 hypothetical protein [Phenylobacterium sp.]